MVPFRASESHPHRARRRLAGVLPSRVSHVSHAVTLIELVIVTVILGIVVVGLGAMFMSSAKLWGRGGTVAEIQADLSLGLERIAQELRSATSVVVSDDGTSLSHSSDTRAGSISLSGDRLVIEREEPPGSEAFNVYSGDDLANVTSVVFAPRATRVVVQLVLAAAGESVSGSSSVAVRNIDQTQMIGHWGFNEGSGDVAFDSSPAGNHGALHETTWAAGPEGAFALTFDDSEPSYIEIPDTSALDTAARMLYEFNVTGGAGTLYQRGDTRVYISSQRIGFEGGPSEAVESASLAWDAGQWYRVVVVVDATDSSPETPGSVQFWRDDTHVSTAAYPFEVDLSGQSGKGYIGTSADFSAAWDGTIDEAVIRRY